MLKKKGNILKMDKEATIWSKRVQKMKLISLGLAKLDVIRDDSASN